MAEPTTSPPVDKRSADKRSADQPAQFVERRQPRPARAGEPWVYALNGVSKRVTVSVVLPVRNEAPNLPQLFAALPPVHEIIVVDGHSADGTVDLVRRLEPTARILHQTGRGKGDAMRVGLGSATGDIVVFIDADGSNAPGEIERFVLALVNGADLAKGSRFLLRGGSTDITPIRKLGNAAIRTWVNRIYGTRFSDIAYGYNALWTKHRDALNLDCSGFEVETLMHIRAARAGLIIEEVPSFEGRRSIGSSNLHAFRDGVRIAAVLVRELADHHLNKQSPKAAPGVQSR
jgi:glycosyltransferase involved in cell wall biosynthesis